MKAQIIKKITTGLTLTAVTASLLSGCATQNGSAATDTTQADATESATESATDTTSKDPVLPDSIVMMHA